MSPWRSSLLQLSLQAALYSDDFLQAFNRDNVNWSTPKAAGRADHHAPAWLQAASNTRADWIILSTGFDVGAAPS